MELAEIIQEQWRLSDAIQASLEVIDPTCILAGGAPRDWYLGSVANDLDFYFHPGPGRCEGQVKMQLERLFNEEVVAMPWSDELAALYAGEPLLRRVFEMDFDGQKVQFMWWGETTFRSVIDSFGCSICKVWRKHGITHREMPFNTTMEQKIIKCTARYNGSPHQIKMAERFPDFLWQTSVEVPDAE